MKGSLRREKLKLRKTMSSEDVKIKSKKINDIVLNLKELKNAKSVLFYYPINNEVDLISTMKWCLSEGKTVLLPRVENFAITMYSISSFSDLKKGFFGIMEPDPAKANKFKGLVDLAFVPGIVFDKEGSRIGYGQGYYDRFLKKLKINKIGVGYGDQLVDAIKAGKHDVALDYVITEDKINNCKNT